jgi:hypothetical protein
MTNQPLSPDDALEPVESPGFVRRQQSIHFNQHGREGLFAECCDPDCIKASKMRRVGDR